MSRFSGLLSRTKKLCSDVLDDNIVEIHSNRYALISGCVRLVEYDREKIVLDLGELSLVIEGQELEPESLINGQMAVKGIIAAVKYELDQENH